MLILVGTGCNSPAFLYIYLGLESVILMRQDVKKICNLLKQYAKLKRDLTTFNFKFLVPHSMEYPVIVA